MYSQISDFIFELAVLKKLPRSGSFIAGVQNPDTVGEHVFRASEVAFILAELEGGNGERSAFLTLIHDNAEARIGDLHKIANKYIGNKSAEEKAFFDQSKSLPDGVAKKYQKAWEELEEGNSIESICAKDADLLELAFQSKEFLEHGYLGKQDWLNNIRGALKTDSAKKIFAEMEGKSCHDWWQGLKKID